MENFLTNRLIGFIGLLFAVPILCTALVLCWGVLFVAIGWVRLLVVG